MSTPSDFPKKKIKNNKKKNIRGNTWGNTEEEHRSRTNSFKKTSQCCINRNNK